MSHAMHYVKEVGNFFGMNKASSEQWKRAAEKQIKDGEFGLSLRPSMHGHAHHSGSNGFLQGAEKMLSKIEAFQEIEESQEENELKDKVNADSKISDNPADDEDVIERPLSLTTPSRKRTLIVLNEAYIDHEEDEACQSTSKTESESPPSLTSSPSRTPTLTALNKAYIDDEKDEACQSTSKTEPEGRRKVQFSVTASDGYILHSKQLHDLPNNKPSASVPELAAHKTALKKNSELNKMSDLNTPFEKAKLIFFDEYLRQQNNSEKESNADDKSSDPGTAKDSELTLSEVEVKLEDQQTNLPKADLLNKEGGGKETSHKQNKTIKLGPDDLAYGKEALEQYYIYKQYEQKDQLSKVQFELDKVMREYDWKLKAVDDLIAMARDFYMNPETNNAAKWRELKTNVRRNSFHVNRTEVRRKLGTLPEYKPFFTGFIIIAQLISFIVCCVLSGFTFIGLEPKLTLESGIQTFMGLETIDRWMPPNVWIGPSDRKLIGMGALFAPCMRVDMKIQLEYSRQNYSIEETLGCCEVASRNVAGTTYQSECSSLTEGVGSWREGVICSERSADVSSVRHTIKPCCVGLKGQCRLLSHKHCMFLSGTFHQFGPDHCSQVNCLHEVCNLGHLEATQSQPWQPENPCQWWRLPLSLFYHHGIIHVLIVSVVQWFLFTPIEHTAGWLRMMVVYVVTGSAALLMSTIFSPYQSHVGGVGAICGMIGLVIVELVQFWSLVQRPLIELGKLCAVIILLLFTGTLPYLDVLGMIVGLLLGILCGVLILPYVTFGKWHAHARVILVLMSFSMLLASYGMLVHVFINVQTVENCKACEWINCVPYTTHMCENWEQL